MQQLEIRARSFGRAESHSQRLVASARVAAPTISEDAPVTAALGLAQAELLTRIELFAGLDRVALARLAACAEALPIGPGEDVCRAGESADGLYVIAAGTFGVYLSAHQGLGETRVAFLHPGH